MSCTIVCGGQYGDEGKGKIAAYLTIKDDIRFAVRAGVGPNACHTFIVCNEETGLLEKCFTFHIPSGLINKETKLFISAGTLINPGILIHEVKRLKIEDRLYIDKNCGIITCEHVKGEEKSEHLRETIKTIGSGCGIANSERAMRKIENFADFLKGEGSKTVLKSMECDVSEEVHKALDENIDVIVEGTQGFGLSLYYGDYPYVTSKDTSASAIAADVGLGPKDVDEVICIFKVYPTRVSKGFLNDELNVDDVSKLNLIEYSGLSTNIKRVGNWDSKLARRAIMVNNPTQIALTLNGPYSSPGVRNFEALSPTVKKLVENLQEELKVPITLISTSPRIEDTIDLREL
ncbi:MAG: adenylosuccinate synthetase [Candidatus Lokiarchaeia archaeon]